MKLPHLFVAYFISGVICAVSVTATAKPLNPSVRVEVGGISLVIPIPEGFSDAGTSKTLSQIGEVMTPQQRRLLAFFVRENDLIAVKAGKEPALDESLSIQTGRADENKNLSTESFAKTRQKIRTEHEVLLAKAVENKTNLETLLKEASEGKGQTVSVQFRGVTPLGIVEESDRSITVAVMSETQVQVGTESSKVPSVTVLTIAIIRGKPIWLKTNVTLRKIGDIDVARDIAKKWIAQILAANGT